MKKTIVINLLIIYSQFTIAQNGVGIGTDNVDNSAILEIVAPANNQGILIPMTDDLNKIIKPTANGIIVYHTVNRALYIYDQSANQWRKLVMSPARTAIDMNNNKVTKLANGTNAKDAVNKSQLDTKISKSSGSVITSYIASKAVTNSKIADNAVDTDQIADGAVDTDQLDYAAVTADKIKSEAVSAYKVDRNSVCTWRKGADYPDDDDALPGQFYYRTSTRELFFSDWNIYKKVATLE